MAYPIRRFDPKAVQFITSRTFDQSLFMVPTPEVVNAVGAALAHSQQRHSIELFDVSCTSNHFHLAVRAPRGNLPDFMRDLKSSIAKGVNRILGRRGHFWEQRYQASPVIDGGAEVERAVYVYGHGPKEGLVDRPEQWPGLASVKERLSGASIEYDLIDYTAMSRAAYRKKQPQNPADFSKKVTLVLSPWPFMKDFTPEQERACVESLVETAVARAEEGRDGKPSLGVAKILEQDPRSRPQSTKRSRRPLCHASTAELRRSYRRQWSGFLEAYREASKRFRDGDASVQFPAYSYRPPLPAGWTPR